MVPRWLPGSKTEPFWVTLGCLFEVFWNVICMIFILNVKCFFKIVVNSGYICDQGLFHLHRFLYVFHVFILTLWTWSRLRRQARPKTTGVVGTCKNEIIILVASVSAHLVNARVVEHFFLRCSSFERASRSLAKTGFHF